MKYSKHSEGYRVVRLRTGFSTRGRIRFIHRLVALAYLENPEGKPQVNHKNGDKADNRISNLEWATARENVHHSNATGLAKYRFGEQHPHARLTDAKVREIRQKLRDGCSMRELASVYEVCDKTIKSIRDGTGWKHVG